MLRKTITIALLLILALSNVSYGIKLFGQADTRLGAYTGPVGGTEQDDTVKASMDLAHTDLDAIIRDLGIVRGTNSSIFYVDSGTAGTTGISWATAVADIEAATVLCAASAGDIIVCAPGHAEAMTATDDIDLDKIGITVICLGEGDLRATFSYTANGEFVFGADNCALYNARFIATSDSVVHAIDVEANVDGFKIIGCEFSAETTTVDEFDDVITISTATTRGVIRGNKFLGDVGANAEPQSCINFNTAHYLEISDNQFYGDRAVACIENAAAANFPLIRDNVLVNGIIGGTAGLNTVACISLHASTSAVIIDNKLFCNVATPDLAIIAADGFMSGNTYNETEGGLSQGSPIGTTAGQTYVAVCTTTTAFAEDLFVVTQPILIESMHGLVTTNISADGGNLHLWCDATTAAQDQTFSTAVAVQGDAAGDVWSFDNTAGLSVLTPTANAGTNSAMGSWFCPIGTIEQSNTDADATGAIVWYMVWRCLVDGTTVTPQ